MRKHGTKCCQCLNGTIETHIQMAENLFKLKSFTVLSATENSVITGWLHLVYMYFYFH